MDRGIRANKSSLDLAKSKNDTEGFWKLWSSSVEEAYIRYLEMPQEAAKQIRGRGKVTLRTMKPKCKGEEKTEEDTVRNKWYFEAIRCLKQARRLEQVLLRGGAKEREERVMGEKHDKLNEEAFV